MPSRASTQPISFSGATGSINSRNVSETFVGSRTKSALGFAAAAANTTGAIRTSTPPQEGDDTGSGDRIVVAFSKADSIFDCDNGNGNGNVYPIAVYGTHMFEKGSYVDFVARYGYIKNDMMVDNTSEIRNA